MDEVALFSDPLFFAHEPGVLVLFLHRDLLFRCRQLLSHILELGELRLVLSPLLLKLLHFIVNVFLSFYDLLLHLLGSFFAFQHT